MNTIPRGYAISNIVYMLFLIIAALIFVSNLSSTQLQSASNGMGRIRHVNMERLQQRIQSNTLSNHKAMFFKVMGRSGEWPWPSPWPWP